MPNRKSQLRRAIRQLGTVTCYSDGTYEEAYKGYLIRSNTAGEIFVSKAGVHICAADSVYEAKRAIERLSS